jgi:hypothetical protein
MAVNLADGVLMLKTPKKEIQEPQKDLIPITESPHEVDAKD